MSAVVAEKRGIGGRNFVFAVLPIFAVLGDLGDAFPSDRRRREHDDGHAGCDAAFGAAMDAGRVDSEGGAAVEGGVAMTIDAMAMDGAVDSDVATDAGGRAMDATLTEWNHGGISYGWQMPQISCCRNSKWVTSGWHRRWVILYELHQRAAMKRKWPQLYSRWVNSHMVIGVSEASEG